MTQSKWLQFFTIGLLATTMAPIPHAFACQEQPEQENAAATEIEKPLLDIKVKHDLSPQQFVLCPSLSFIEKAREKGLDKSVMIYYTSRVVEADEETTKLKSLPGQEFELPNQWLIPIPAEQTAEVGDILLTWWQSGSGMQRALVVGGSNTEPEVMYLDLDYDNPAGVGRKVDKLKPNSFLKLTEAGQVGTTAVAKKGNRYRYGRIVARDENNTVLLCFAGRVEQYSNEDITFLPIVPEVKEGETIQIVAFGYMREGTVKKVDPKIGRVFVEFPFGSNTKEVALSYGQVVKELKDLK